MNIISIVGLGLFLGLKHAIDADHVIAVSTIVSKQKNIFHATLVGIAWGVGHTIMIIVVGMMIIFFHVSIPVRLQLFFEFSVAIVLVLLGLKNLHLTPHAHTHVSQSNAPILVRPFVVGLVHGLAGSAAIALLILSSISDERLAIMYLGVFGLGTIVGMTSVTTLIAIPFVFSQSKFYKLDRVFTTIAGIVSILYGIYYGFRLLSGPSPSFPVGI